MVVIFKEHYLPEKKDSFNTSKSNKSPFKKHGTDNGEEKLLKASVPTRTQDQTTILILFAKFLYIALKLSKKNNVVTSGSNPIPTLLS